MGSRKRLLQAITVVALAASSALVSSLSAATTSSGSWWCANSCSGTAVCNPGGGSCFPASCLGIDDRWYDYTIHCFEQ